MTPEASVVKLLNAIAAAGGDERFISEGYEAHDAIVEGVVSIVEREVAALSARCTALEQERDYWSGMTKVVSQQLADLFMAHHKSRSRCQHLEQAVKGYLTDLQTIRDGALNVAEGDNAEDLRTFWRGKVIAYDVVLEGLPKRLAALASLLPSQDEAPRTDENRVSFAAGYSTALDDVLKDRKP